LTADCQTVDDNGKSLANDFDGQVRQLFKNLDRPAKAGGSLGDIVHDVFITESLR